MRYLFAFLVLLSILTACTGNTAQVPTYTIPTATSLPSTPELAAATAEVIPSSVEASPIPAPSDDFFTQMGVALTTPTCTGPTQSQTEGPYYKPDTPQRNSLLEEGMPGTRLILVGYVLDQNCQPLPNAWLDFWQADDQGAYDNAGYRLRGHQFTDENGRYQLETIIPGEYPGRPPHIHVKVQAPEGPVLTTQLDFPGSSGNENDPLFSAETLLNLQESENGFLSEFNFVVEK